MREVDRDVMVWPADAAEQSCRMVSIEPDKQCRLIGRKAACGEDKARSILLTVLTSKPPYWEIGRAW